MKDALLFAASLFLLVGCARSKSQISASPTLMIFGSPSAVYDRVLPAITQRLRSGTKVVRTDDPGVVVMRFSVPAEDRSVRLLDVVLKKAEQRTEVVAHSKKFTVIFSAARDQTDLSVETAILELFKEEPNKAPEPTSPSVTDRAGARSAPAGAVAHL